MSGSYLDRFGVLTERNFRRLFVGQSASLLGDGMVGVALSFAVLDLTGSPSDLGIVLGAKSVSLIFTLLIGGVFADRLPRRSVMVAADLTRCAGQATMAALLIAGDARIWELAALQAVQGLATGVFNPASVGLIPSLVTADRLQQANALRGMAMSAGNVLGPAVSGVLVAATSPGWAIAADAASFAYSAALLSRLDIPPHQPPPAQPFMHDLLEGWKEFKSRTWVWVTVGYGTVTNLLFPVFVVLGPAVARNSLGGPRAWATILAAFGIGSVVGGFVVLHIKPHRPLRTAMTTMTLFPLPVIGLAIRLPVLAIAGVCLLSGAGLTVFNALWETALQRSVPAGAISRVSAYDWFGSLASQPVGQAAAGFLAAAIGVDPGLWLVGGLQIVATLGALTVPSIRALSNEDGGPMPVTAAAEDTLKVEER